MPFSDNLEVYALMAFQGIDIQIETTMERKFDEHLVRAPVDSTMDIKVGEFH